MFKHGHCYNRDGKLCHPRYPKGKYILVTVNHHKNAVRHIEDRSDDLDALQATAKHCSESNDRYDYLIYSGNWQLLYTYKGGKLC